jgi:hypothetical protein
MRLRNNFGNIMQIINLINAVHVLDSENGRKLHVVRQRKESFGKLTVAYLGN